MTRRWRVPLLAAMLCILALASLPWNVAQRTVERYLLTRLSAQFALSGATAASGAIAFLPVPRIVANDVAFSSKDGSLTARVGRIRADLRLLSLLQGKIAFTAVTLVSPQIDAQLPSETTDPLALMVSSDITGQSGWPHVSITGNGSVFLRQGRGIVSSVRDINADMMARSAGEALQVSGNLVWRGEKLDFAFATNSAARDILPMFRIRSDIVSVDFASARTARGTAPASAMLDGQIQISTRSMSRLGTWLASGSPVMLPLGSTAIGGRLQMSAEGAQINNASVTLGSDVLDGALDWRKREHRWRLTGTLAGKNLDIGRPQSGVDVQRLSIPDLSATAPIDIDDLLAHDIDVRVSLQRLRLQGLVLSDVAGQVMATDQRLDLSISNAGLYGGVARGRGSMARVQGGIELKTQLNAERVDLAQLSADLFDVRRMTGVGSVQYMLDTSGRTPADLVAHATGKFAITARNGDVMGANLNDAMRRIERQPLSVVRDWRGGRTAFDTIAFRGTVAGGNIEISEARGSGAAFRLSMDGQMSLLDRSLKLGGLVHSANGATSIPFDVSGSLADPSVQLDAKAFLERSGAAAPNPPQRAN